VTENENFAEAAAQIPVISAAWSFLVPFYEDKNLRAAWPNADADLRLCWAQWWADANTAALEANGYDLDEVARTLVSGQDRHGLWPSFERVLLRDFHATFPLDPRGWGIGAAPRVVAPDVELLYVHAELPAGGVWAPGASAEVVPVLMRLTERRWRVLNLGYETIPQPGWPPKL
jgi:hypothetical protein